MRTEILKVDSNNIEPIKIKKAAQIIKEGGLVAFPTETVYGLGADAFNPEAVAKIFEVKKRPLNDPLIVHIADRKDLFRLSNEVQHNEVHKITMRLIDEFWPGPLTLVLKKTEKVPLIVTGGLETVAVRMPLHPLALNLIRESKTPIAAPSANLFGRPSPTTAQHVLDDLVGKIDMVIDGGKTDIGIESTILDLTQTPFCILRPGGVSIEKLKKIIPDVELYPVRNTKEVTKESKISNGVYKQDRILSPGMYPRHYSPKAKLILIEGNGKTQVDKVHELAKKLALQGYFCGIIAKEENKDKYVDFNVKSLGPADNLTLCATNLFSILREFDKDGAQVIIVEGVEEKGLGIAIMDRLRKAQGLVKNV